jgi:hypothetical protein
VILLLGQMVEEVLGMPASTSQKGFIIEIGVVGNLVELCRYDADVVSKLTELFGERMNMEF